MTDASAKPAPMGLAPDAASGLAPDASPGRGGNDAATARDDLVGHDAATARDDLVGHDAATARDDHDPADPDGQPATDAEPGGLSDRDRAILDFERKWWKYAGAKEQAIRELFNMSATRYYQVLNALLDTPAALAHDPILVKRMRRMRQARQRARGADRLGGP